jgi:hypothetical protein
MLFKVISGLQPLPLSLLPVHHNVNNLCYILPAPPWSASLWTQKYGAQQLWAELSETMRQNTSFSLYQVFWSEWWNCD